MESGLVWIDYQCCDEELPSLEAEGYCGVGIDLKIETDSMYARSLSSYRNIDELYMSTIFHLPRSDSLMGDSRSDNPGLFKNDNVCFLTGHSQSTSLKAEFQYHNHSFMHLSIPYPTTLNAIKYNKQCKKPRYLCILKPTTQTNQSNNKNEYNKKVKQTPHPALSCYFLYPWSCLYYTFHIDNILNDHICNANVTKPQNNRIQIVSQNTTISFPRRLAGSQARKLASSQAQGKAFNSSLCVINFFATSSPPTALNSIQ